MPTNHFKDKTPCFNFTRKTLQDNYCYLTPKTLTESAGYKSLVHEACYDIKKLLKDINGIAKPKKSAVSICWLNQFIKACKKDKKFWENQASEAIAFQDWNPDLLNTLEFTLSNIVDLLKQASKDNATHLTIKSALESVGRFATSILVELYTAGEKYVHNPSTAKQDQGFFEFARNLQILSVYFKILQLKVFIGMKMLHDAETRFQMLNRASKSEESLTIKQEYEVFELFDHTVIKQRSFYADFLHRLSRSGIKSIIGKSYADTFIHSYKDEIIERFLINDVQADESLTHLRARVRRSSKTSERQELLLSLFANNETIIKKSNLGVMPYIWHKILFGSKSSHFVFNETIQLILPWLPAAWAHGTDDKTIKAFKDSHPWISYQFLYKQKEYQKLNNESSAYCADYLKRLVTHLRNALQGLRDQSKWEVVLAKGERFKCLEELKKQGDELLILLNWLEDTYAQFLLTESTNLLSAFLKGVERFATLSILQVFSFFYTGQEVADYSSQSHHKFNMMRNMLTLSVYFKIMHLVAIVGLDKIRGE